MKETLTIIIPVIVAIIGIYPKLKENQDKLVKAINEINEKLDKHIEDDRKDYAIVCRSRILRYANEMYAGETFTEDKWNAIYQDCKDYKEYAETHPDFPNGICETTIQMLNEKLIELVREGSIKIHNE